MKILHLLHRDDANHTSSRPGLYTCITQGLSAEGRNQVQVASFLKEKNTSTGQSLNWAKNHTHKIYLDFPKRKLRRLFTLYRYLRREDFDAVVSHRLRPMLTFAYIAPFLRCRRWYFVFHGMDQLRRWRHRAPLALLCRKHWRLIAVSETVRQDLLKRGFSPEKVITIRNALDIKGIRRELLTREEARQFLGIPTDCTVIGSVGRLVPVKGHLCLLEGIAPLLRERTDLHLLLVGDGPLSKELKQRACQLGIQDRLTLPGRVPSMVRYLRAFDIFVLPSLQEGLPLALYEALAAKVPALASAIGSCQELLGEEGLYFAPQSAADLQRVLSDFLHRSPQKQASYAETLYSRLWQVSSPKVLMESYRRLVESTPPSS